jgi:glycosyltransferase involved in cell wall biosynthesis
MKVFVLAAQAPFPPRDGGTERSAAIFSVIAAHVKVQILWPTERPFDSLVKVANGIEQFAVSLNPVSVILLKIFRKVLGTGSWGPSFALSPLFLLRIRKILDKQMLEEDVLILDQPWMIKALPKNPRFRILLNAHNAEKEVFRASSTREIILKRFITNLESDALKIVDGVLYCTEQDFKILKQYPSCQNLTGVHLQNGVFQRKKNALPRDTNSFIFVGSAHQPNITAAKILVQLAKIMPEIEIYLVGDVCSHIKDTTSNVKLMGRVSETNLQLLLSTCSAFLNPVTEGSGMHLKIARAIASEIPIITTEFGARGFNLQHNKSAIFSQVENFEAAIQRFLILGRKRSDIARQALKSSDGVLFWEDIIDASKILGTKFPKQRSAIRKSLNVAFDVEFFPHKRSLLVSFLLRASRKISHLYKDL